MRTLLLTNFRTVPDGTAAAASLSFTSEPNTGFFRQAAGALGFSILGTERMRLNATGVMVNSITALSGSTISFDSTLILPIARVFRFTAGTNQKAGNAVLVAGTVTVGCTGVTANSVICLTRKTIGGTCGNLSYTLNAGVGFTINSDNVADTSTITFVVMEVA
jgi:hypothetical protein